MIIIANSLIGFQFAKEGVRYFAIENEEENWVGGEGLEKGE